MYNPYVKRVPPKPTYNVYDPITKGYSVGWFLMYIENQPDRWIPVWRECDKKK